MIDLNKSESIFNDPTAARWDNFTAQLRGTILFAKVHMAAENSTVISANYNLLLFALGSSRNENDLQFCLERLVAAMGENLSFEEINSFNSLLAQFEFGFTV